MYGFSVARIRHARSETRATRRSSSGGGNSPGYRSGTRARRSPSNVTCGQKSPRRPGPRKPVTGCGRHGQARPWAVRVRSAASRLVRPGPSGDRPARHGPGRPGPRGCHIAAPPRPAGPRAVPPRTTQTFHPHPGGRASGRAADRSAGRLQPRCHSRTGARPGSARTAGCHGQRTSPRPSSPGSGRAAPRARIPGDRRRAMATCGSSARWSSTPVRVTHRRRLVALQQPRPRIGHAERRPRPRLTLTGPGRVPPCSMPPWQDLLAHSTMPRHDEAARALRPDKRQPFAAEPRRSAGMWRWSCRRRPPTAGRGAAAVAGSRAPPAAPSAAFLAAVMAFPPQTAHSVRFVSSYPVVLTVSVSMLNCGLVACGPAPRDLGLWVPGRSSLTMGHEPRPGRRGARHRGGAPQGLRHGARRGWRELPGPAR